ncbi:MAG: hypothetical protein GC185_10945 [Alphaproteobacteria bacterium]|nr:hypothetical protein [Alphaproteobacteria bacterium]
MMKSLKAFPGRVIFDHIPKTAGTAVNSWLTEALGTGCITQPLAGGGQHRELIRAYGGDYSIISSHVSFIPGEGFDPRYQYMTCLREPVDRVISWLYFVVSNEAGTPSEYSGAKLFLEGKGGADFPGAENISNYTTEHFCRIFSANPQSDDEKVENAFAAIRQYDVVGIYEDMPRFIADIARLIRIPASEQINRRNVTSDRPDSRQLAPSLRKRIVALNRLDLRLHERIRAWKASMQDNDAHSSGDVPAVVEWQKHEETGYIAPMTKVKGNIFVSGVAPESLAAGSKSRIDVEIVNADDAAWVGDRLRPLTASYHWLESSGEMLTFNGLRTPLPTEKIMPGKKLPLSMQVQAPENTGTYQLVLTLVQENVTWLENIGFEPAVLNIEVTG